MFTFEHPHVHIFLTRNNKRTHTHAQVHIFLTKSHTHTRAHLFDKTHTRTHLPDKPTSKTYKKSHKTHTTKLTHSFTGCRRQCPRDRYEERRTMTMMTPHSEAPHGCWIRKNSKTKACFSSLFLSSLLL